MARWKARVEFLLSVIELLFLSLTVEALQGKMCQNTLLSGGGRSVRAKVSGERVVPGEYFLVSTKLDTFFYPTVQTALCYVPSFWHNTGMCRTDRWTDRRNCYIASTALAMRALWSAVITTVNNMLKYQFPMLCLIISFSCHVNHRTYTYTCDWLHLCQQLVHARN